LCLLEPKVIILQGYSTAQPQQHWPKHAVDKLHTPDNIVVL